MNVSSELQLNHNGEYLMATSKTAATAAKKTTAAKPAASKPAAKSAASKPAAKPKVTKAPAAKPEAKETHIADQIKVFSKRRVWPD